MTFWGRKLLFGDVNYFLRAYIRKEVRIFGAVRMMHGFFGVKVRTLNFPSHKSTPKNPKISTPLETTPNVRTRSYTCCDVRVKR